MHQNKATQIDRRTVLRAAGVSLCLPLMETFGAQGVKPGEAPKRMLAVCQDLGFIPSNFFPKGKGKDYTLSPYLKRIAAHRDQFTVFSGISHPDVDGGHRADKCFLTAAPHPGRASFRNTISLDQAMADEVGHETRFRSLSLSVNDGRSLSYTQAGVAIPTIQSATELYKRLFLQGDAQQMQAQLLRLKRKQSILDVVLGQTSDLTRRVSKSDRQKLDQFQTSVRSLEKRMSEQQAWAQKPKPVTDAAQPNYPKDRKQLFTMTQMMYEMSSLALQTDSTRVITLLLGCQRTPGVHLNDGRTFGGYHNISHHGKDEQKLKELSELELIHMDLLNDLLNDLKGVQEQNGSLLDHTMVLYGSHLGDANIHNNKNMPVLLAGGGFKHGRHLSFDELKNKPLPNLYVDMLQNMGIEKDRFASSSGTVF